MAVPMASIVSAPIDGDSIRSRVAVSAYESRCAAARKSSGSTSRVKSSVSTRIPNSSPVASSRPGSIPRSRRYSVSSVEVAPTFERRSTNRASIGARGGWWSMTIATSVSGGSPSLTPGREWSTSANDPNPSRSESGSSAVGS